MFAASKPMAQSAVSLMFSAVCFSSARESMVPRLSRMSSMIFSSISRPSLQGTHFPQDWAWHTFRMDRVCSTAHTPGGVAAMRWTNCPLMLSPAARIFAPVITDNLLIFLSPELFFKDLMLFFPI